MMNRNFQPPSRDSSASPRLVPQITVTNDKEHYYPLYQLPHDFVPTMPRMIHNFHHSKAFSLHQTTPLSSRSPSVDSWCSFDSDYEDMLVIEEIDSDDENLDDSNVEVIEGEYEDPPSDDDEYWDRRRHRQELNDTQNMIVNGFEELSTSVNTPTCAFLSPRQMFTSPTPSAGSKRNFVDSDTDAESDTDLEDCRSTSGRRTRRRLTLKVPSSSRTTRPMQVARGFNVPTLRESEMEE